jgi:hypothetical protein
MRADEPVAHRPEGASAPVDDVLARENAAPRERAGLPGDSGVHALCYIGWSGVLIATGVTLLV